MNVGGELETGERRSEMEESIIPLPIDTFLLETRKYASLYRW